MKYLLSIIFVFISFTVVTQSQRVIDADKYYSIQKYPEAIQLYNSEINNSGKKGYDTTIDLKLARCYNAIFNYEKARVSYEVYFSKQSQPDSLAVKEYIKLLLTLGEYEYVLALIDEKVEEGEVAEEDVVFLKQKCEWAINNANIDKSILVEHVNWIGEPDRYFGLDVFDSIVYLSVPQKVKEGETSVYKLMQIRLIDSVTFGEIEKIKKFPETNFHTGFPQFNSDGSLLYFTQNASGDKKYNPNKPEKFKRSSTGENNMELAFVERKGDTTWGKVQTIEFCNPEYSYTHPFLSEDDKTLYFASNKKGGYGGYDIWKSERIGDTAWSEPENLGPKVNSNENEGYPRVNEETLYFSSNGWLGFGGMDIYKASEDTVKNLGYPFNSSSDDISIFFSKNGGGYFASNREEENGNDRLYHYETVSDQTIDVRALVLPDTLPLESVKVLYTVAGIIDSSFTDIEGRTSLTYSPVDSITIVVAPIGYDEKKFTFAPGKAKPVDAFFKIKGIEFDFNKSNIRNYELRKLDMVISILQSDEEWRVDIEGHTDSRGPKDYNNYLSRKRAQIVYRYLRDKGEISRDRISYKYYGEDRLLNNCSDDVECDDKEHQKNRRTSIILSKKGVDTEVDVSEQ